MRVTLRRFEPISGVPGPSDGDTGGWGTAAWRQGVYANGARKPAFGKTASGYLSNGRINFRTMSYSASLVGAKPL